MGCVSSKNTKTDKNAKLQLNQIQGTFNSTATTGLTPRTLPKKGESFCHYNSASDYANEAHISSSHSFKLSDNIKRKSIFLSRIIKGLNILDFYTIHPTILGTGISGAVRKATHRETQRVYAIKTLNTRNISPKKAFMLHNEVSIYLQLDHPNIAKLHEVYEDDSAIHLVMELCMGKELFHRLASKKKYKEKDAISVTKNMLSAINYCHNHHICHRDLKLENWVYSTNSEDASLKLIDFGFSRIFNPGVPMTAMHGTVYYVSPEVMAGSYKEKCDIWSIGVIIYMLLCGAPPFNGSQDNEILMKIKKGTYSMEGHRWQGISPLAKDFVGHLLRQNPDERPSAEEALKHPWLNQNNPVDVHINIEVLKSMQRFAAGSAIKRAALALIALSMDTREVEDLERIFKKIDTDGSGTIKLEELAAVLTEKLNISKEEAHRIFKFIDQTGDSEILYSEFLASTLQAKVVLDESLIRQAFQKFDVDHTGYISLDNLKQVFGDHYDENLEKGIIEYFDKKNSGRIDYVQFLAAITGDDFKSTNDESVVCDRSSEDQLVITRSVSKNILNAVNSMEI